MQENISKNLLIKYCKNKCSKEEIALVESWYLALSKKKDVVITIEDLKETKKMLDAALHSKLNTNSTYK